MGQTIVISAFIAIIETSNSKAHAAVFISLECSEEKQAPDCEKNGSSKYIYIYDSIEMETADAVARVNGAFPIGEPFPLMYLNSEGESGTAAYQIGSILRQRSASVERKDMFFPNRMPSRTGVPTRTARRHAVSALEATGLFEVTRTGKHATRLSPEPKLKTEVAWFV